MIKAGVLLGQLLTREIRYVHAWQEVFSISQMHAKELARVLSSRLEPNGTLALVDLEVGHFFPGASSWEGSHKIHCPICNCVLHSAREAAIHFGGKNHLRRSTRASDYIRSIFVARNEPTHKHSDGAHKLEDYHLCSTCGILVNPDEERDSHGLSKKHVAGASEAFQDSIGIGGDGTAQPRYRSAAVASIPISDRRVLLGYLRRSTHIINAMYEAHSALIAEIITGREAYQDDSEDSNDD